MPQHRRHEKQKAKKIFSANGSLTIIMNNRKSKEVNKYLSLSPYKNDKP